MERLKTLFKKLTKKEYLPFWFFAGVQLIYHWMMREGPGTDAMWFFRNQLDAYSPEGLSYDPLSWLELETGDRGGTGICFQTYAPV